ncbi:MAG: DUF2809 domain-containing protein [Bacteroidales bacterium]|nr:DUF2809 domain-containing protein [Bacteroidales bacterium]
MRNKLLYSLLGLVVLIPLGLLSRRVNALPNETGDALWSMMVFCFWRILLVNRPLKVVAAIALVHSFVVEFSQLLTFPWLVSFRRTFIGHMMLGQGFLWIDLVAYTVGVLCIYWVYRRIERR